MKIAVILFPGTNCENETKRACVAVGMDAEIIRWNQDVDYDDYDGFILPGGWSYEDRIRAGAIAAKDNVMGKIKEQAEKGKPVLGICNGCQVLIETGMVPGNGKVEMAMAPNINDKYSGFYCTWIKLKNTGKKNAFNMLYKDDEIIPMPIAHGEGRFTTKQEGLVEELEKNRQIVFKYSGYNPNGSLADIAGISNKKGNVLAMMPHPERGMFEKMLPEKKGKDGDSFTSAALIFKSMKKFIEEK